MHNFLDILGNIVNYGGWVVGGIFALGGIFSQQLATRRKENETVANSLIQNLKTTVEQQTKDMASMNERGTRRDEEIKKLSADMSHLQGRNAVLEDLFKGRDPAMQAFLKDAPSLIQIAKENNGLAKENSVALTHLTESIANFVNTITPILTELQLKKL